MTTINSPIAKSLRFLGIALSISILIACSSKVDPIPEEPAAETTEGGIPFYKVQRVENLYVQVDDNDPNMELPELLYSLEFKKIQPANTARTSNWDLSFSGMYASFMAGNNNTDPENTGYKGVGKGGITIVEQPFEDVTEIPSELQFKTGPAEIGTDLSGAFGTGIGWYIYDFDATLLGNGADNKKHVAYALGNGIQLNNGKQVPARTVILRTANGNFAKIKMISCYKDTADPTKMFTSTPKMYFTFDYVLVPKQSSQFIIK